MACCDSHRWRDAWTFAIVAALTGCSSSVGPGAGDGGSSFDATADANDGSPFFFQDSSSNCVPGTCQRLGYTCGVNGDGCGGLIDCGTCTAPLFCGGGGYGKCGGSAGPPLDAGALCVPRTCQNLGFNCGPAADGCGDLLQCGTCAPPQFCGGGGFSVCGGSTSLPDAGCSPATCAQLDINCGPAGDGCGNLMAAGCGWCTPPQRCGGGGYGKCGGSTGPVDAGGACVPMTCSQLGYNCGTSDDGCGGTLQCGTCTPPSTCSGGGGYNHCGTFRSDGGACLHCNQLPASATCGQLSDGCGDIVSCGPGCISPPETCGGGGVPFYCGSGRTCTPLACAQLNYNCGSYGDGCGGRIDCGTCTSPDFCGAGGFNRCGADSGAGGDGGLDAGADQ